MDHARYLFEVEAIKQLKARYFRFFDTKQWEPWLALFTEDVTLEFDMAIAPKAGEDARTASLKGVQALRDFVPSRNVTSRTVHHGHMPEIDILSDTEAKGVWAMEDYLVHDGATAHGYGHYHETYRKVDGAWRVASVRLTRLHFTTTLTRDVIIP